jgi:TRAP-type C4-dicarboxylate transport system permease small subunit
LELIAIVAIGLMCLVIVADIIAKFVFGKPITGTLEFVSNYFMISVVFLPMAAVQRARGHVDVEIFTLFLKPRGLAALDALVTLVGTVSMAWFTWISGGIAYEKFLSGEAVGLAYHSVLIWPARWIIPFSAAVFAVILAEQSVASFRRMLAAPAQMST